MIDLTYSNGAVYVWKVEDVYKLRMELRIVGNFVGCLPFLPRQDQLMGLPMQLNHEEVNLLVSKKLARVISYDELKEPIGQAVADWRDEMHQRSLEEQNALYKEERRKQLMQMAEKIIEGKRKKHGSGSFNEKAALDEEFKKISDMDESYMMIQIFTRPTWNLVGKEMREFNSNHQSIRCAVFIDLWNRGYYLTSGEKFGGDFLAYPSDPVKFHSHYIVVCVKEDELLSPHFLIAKGRLGTNVKKTVLLCSLNSDGHVTYQSLQWEGI